MQQESDKEYGARATFSYLVRVKDIRLANFPIPIFIDIVKSSTIKVLIGLDDKETFQTSLTTELHLGIDRNVFTVGEKAIAFSGNVEANSKLHKHSQSLEGNGTNLDVYEKHPDDNTFTLNNKPKVDIVTRIDDMALIRYAVNQVFNDLLFDKHLKDIIEFHLPAVDEMYRQYWKTLEESSKPSLKIKPPPTPTIDESTNIKEQKLAKFQEWKKTNDYFSQ